MNNKYTVGDLFAGAGGLSKAFQEAGAEVVWANEFDRDACSLYRENFSEVCLDEADIRKVESKNIPSLDILISGFPCQPFSLAKKRKGINDEIGNLFFEVLRILNQKKPRAFFLENVKALKSHNNGRILENVTEELSRMGYYIKFTVLNSIDYGNIPHSKEQIYIVGFREKKEYENFHFPKKIRLDVEVSDFFHTKERKEDKYYCRNTKYYSKFKELITKQDMVYQLKTISRTNKTVLEEYNFCPALSTYNIPLINDGFDIRKLTPIECFNFKGFFDIKIPKFISETNLYKCAFGCSSVTVVKRIAKNILEVIDNRRHLNDDNEMLSDTDVAFKCHKNKLYEFEGNNKLPISIISSNFNIGKKIELNNFKQQIAIEKYMSKVEENVSVIEDEEVNVDTLIRKLSEIKPGREQAITFHEYMSKVVNFIFEGYLIRQRIEAVINEGRKRIDIMFDNLSEKGFFYELRSLHNVFCPKIIIECKNYSSTPSNPEIDQLIGRFNNRIGKFGILICRNIGDKEILNNKCKDALYGGQGHIIVLSDEDIKKLVIFRQDSNIEGINNYLRDKLDELIL